MSKKIPHWVINGLSWGAVMFTLMDFIMPWVRDGSIVLRQVLIGLPIWVVGGLAFGRFIHWIQQRNAAKDPGKRSMRR
jgi:hypothetical protein